MPLVLPLLPSPIAISADSEKNIVSYYHNVMHASYMFVALGTPLSNYFIQSYMVNVGARSAWW